MTLRDNSVLIYSPCVHFWFGDDVLELRVSLVLMYWPSSLVLGPSDQFIPDLLALWASLVLNYWPFGPIWSECTGPSGQFGSDVLALRVLIYWDPDQLRFWGHWEADGSLRAVTNPDFFMLATWWRRFGGNILKSLTHKTVKNVCVTY